jgi:hypothetical protein
MLQRIQTLYLFGALIVNFLFLFVPIESSPNNAVSQPIDKILIALSLVLSGILLLTIFSYKNRKRQLMFCKLLFVGYLFQMLLSNLLFKVVELKWNGILPYASIFLTFLAYRAINRDEKLVRSADRLR